MTARPPDDLHDDSGHGEEGSVGLQEARLRAVEQALLASGAETVLDLGCGPGPLLERLARSPRFRHIVGVDLSLDALAAVERRLARHGIFPGSRIRLLHGSFADPSAGLEGFDAAVMVETIEHIDPERLSAVESAVFGRYRPGTVIVTTPNRDCNELLGVPHHRFRHPDHRFEWGRERFRSWCAGVAGRNGYDAAFEDVGWAHPHLGGPTQMAVFVRADRAVGT
ncbi:MAG: methyltransferase domain-containing protein [Rhodospirillaceae bacterium]